VSAPGGGPAALERLAIALGPGFITILVTGPGRPAHLSVTCRDTRAGEEVYADESGWFWWPWAERIAATSDPLAAAHHITAALRRTVPVGGQQ
jgi:hypothetical protein